MKRTYCLQVGFHFSTELPKEIERLDHMIGCKPFLFDDKSKFFTCNCKKYELTTSEVGSILTLAMFEGTVHLRLD